MAPVQAPQMFFDAHSTKFTRDGSKQLFEGNVVAIGVGTMVGADRLWIDREADRVEAVGHVVVISKSQVFAGDRLDYDLKSGKFSLTNSWMVANDSKVVAEVSQRTLGVTSNELDFEVQRTARLAEIQDQKELLVGRYQSLMLSGAVRDAGSVAEAYAVLLQREDLIRQQENPHLARAPQEVRQAIKARRAFWKKSQQDAAQSSSYSRIGYFRIEGESIKRIGENNFRADEAFMTPCKCEAGERPAWAFKARRIEARIGGYADLYDPVIEIKGIPVFYFPFLKVPVKGKRQSGFLPPGLTYSSRNGSVSSIPLFLALSDDSDATVTTDFYEKRGLRLGVEYRHELRRHSGWKVQFEGIRDRLWETTHLTRARFKNQYEAGLSSARSTYTQQNDGNPQSGSASTSEGSDESLESPKTPAETLATPEWWLEQDADLASCVTAEDPEECRQHLIRNRIGPQSLPWRGQVEWQGQSFLAPRLQFVSTGHVLSDHRYLGDLFVPSADETFVQVEPRLFTDAAWQFHLDGRKFYLGLGGKYGDFMLTDRRFSGLQLPLALSLSSHYFRLVPGYWPLVAYSQVEYDMRVIDGSRTPGAPSSLDRAKAYLGLTDGFWQRFRWRTVSPIVTDSVVTVDHFTDLEARYVKHGLRFLDGRFDESPHQRLLEGSEEPSTVRTWRTGFNFNLPLDGRVKLSEHSSPALQRQVARFLEHRMNWGMTLSVRPSVVSRGRYGHTDSQYISSDDGELQSNDIPLIYFDSDILRDFNNQIIDEKNSMVPHQKIIFKTSHDWLLFDTAWNRIAGQVPDSRLPDRKQAGAHRYYHMKARKELETFLDQPVRGVDQIIDGKDTWLVSRYRLTEQNRIRPIHFDATTSFDYIKEKRRKQLKSEGAKGNRLPKAWAPVESNLSLNLGSWSLGNTSKFDIYVHTFTDMLFSLGPPSIWGLSTGFGYEIKRTISLSDQGDRTVQETRTRQVSVSGTLTPHIKWSTLYGLKTIESTPGPEQRTGKLSTTYLSPSDCWGLKFEWEKPYSEPDWHRGNFFVGLMVKFFGHYRDYGNFLGRLNNRDS